MFHIAFYRDKDGNSEIIDFLDELQKKGKTSKTDRVNRIKILAYLQALQEYGTHMGQPMVKHRRQSLGIAAIEKSHIFLLLERRHLCTSTSFYKEDTKDTGKGN